VSLVYRLMAQKGYPWTLDLHALYDLSADGLTVTVTATNLSASPAPFAQGAHPYLSVGGDGIDGWELTLPASDRVTVDSRMIPSGREPVDETGYDFRRPRPLKDVTLDTAFTDLRREPDGRAEILLRNPAADRAVALWMDAQHGWVQVYTGDDLGDRARRAVAIEPVTAPPNAFRTGEDLVVLAPAGSDGDEHSSSWGIRSV
jgi:aldose 1-epimerase